MRLLPILLSIIALRAADPAQGVVRPTFAGFASTSQTSPGLGAQTASALIAARAQALGTRVSPSGTLYKSITKFQAAGWSGADLEKELTGVEVSNPAVRSVEIQIDLGGRPITVSASVPVYIGTVVVDSAKTPNVGNLTVTAEIVGVNLIIVPKYAAAH